MAKKTLLLTGGHARSTAFAVIQEIRSRKLGWKVVFVGSDKALSGKNVPTIESDYFPEIKVDFYPISFPKLKGKMSLYNLFSIFKMPCGFFQAVAITRRIKPDLVLSFGGYSAFPIVMAAKVFRRFVIIHEQTSAVGRANKLSSFFCDIVAVSRKSSVGYFSSSKTTITGNPISQGITGIKVKKELSKPPIILVHGGQTGSVTINNCIRESLSALLEKYYLIHQTGDNQINVYKNIKKNLKENLRLRYEVVATVKPDNWYQYVKRADLVISRSGANIVSELIAAKRPAIFIPIPFSNYNEQYENALFAQRFGIGRIINQKDLNSNLLISTIDEMISNWKGIVEKVSSKISPDINASRDLVDLICKNI